MNIGLSAEMKSGSNGFYADFSNSSHGHPLRKARRNLLVAATLTSIHIWWRGYESTTWFSKMACPAEFLAWRPWISGTGR